MRLEEILKRHLPEDDPRTELPTTCALLVLVRNVLLSRQPVYGVGDWAAGFAPDLFDLWRDEVALLHDDRLGGCLDRLFESVGPELILAVVRHVVGSRDRVTLVRGAAGVGKTSLMQEAVEAIEAGGTKVIALAPSASASRGTLREAGFENADTVARFLLDEKL